MNTQAELIRETLEKLSSSGSVEIYHGEGYEDRFSFGDDYKTRKIAEGILDSFPEEDSQSVKAFRALEFFLRYFNQRDFEHSDFFDESVMSQHLTRIQGEIEQEALEDIKNRLDKSENPTPFGEGESRVLHDPISKISSQITRPEMYSEEQHKEMISHEILQAPLR
jgi:hypothetical protein